MTIALDELKSEARRDRLQRENNDLSLADDVLKAMEEVHQRRRPWLKWFSPILRKLGVTSDIRGQICERIATDNDRYEHGRLDWLLSCRLQQRRKAKESA